jgi:hypothetical protein
MQHTSKNTEKQRLFYDFDLGMVNVERNDYAARNTHSASQEALGTSHAKRARLNQEGVQQWPPPNSTTF